MYGFRLDAVQEITSCMARPLRRLALLLVLGRASGLFLVLGAGVRAVSWQLRQAHPVRWAFTAMLVAAIVAVAAGGSYWRHYLVQLAPAAVVATAL